MSFESDMNPTSVSHMELLGWFGGAQTAHASWFYAFSVIARCLGSGAVSAIRMHRAQESGTITLDEFVSGKARNLAKLTVTKPSCMFDAKKWSADTCCTSFHFGIDIRLAEPLLLGFFALCRTWAETWAKSFVAWEGNIRKYAHNWRKSL